MEQLLNRAHDHSVLDHTLVEFWTDSTKEIPKHLYAQETLEDETFYVLSLVIWRNCDSVTLAKKYEDANIVIEFLTETKARIDAMGGTYILNLNFGLWSIVMILVGLV